MEIKSREIAILRDIVNRFDDQSFGEKSRLLKKLSFYRIRNSKILKEYHDLLLFICAHPEHESLLELASQELERIGAAVTYFTGSKDEDKRTSLNLTGIYQTELIASFSFELIEWLRETCSKHIRLQGCDISDFTPQEIIRFGMLPVETQLIESKDMGLHKWLKCAFGKTEKTALDQIMRHLSTIDASAEIRDYVFDSLKLFIRMQLSEKAISRTFLRAPAGHIYFHQEPLIREINLKKLLDQKLPKAITLTSQQKKEYVNTAKMSLLLNFRETDPVTFADPDATEVYELGRGISLALYTMRPDRRHPLDSYIGYMAFRNRIPCAYGGAWIFRTRSRIGINILPPFRKGESALLFGRILQVYRQKYQIRFFEAEPYQIGKNNPEGIQTGAFWFYYKLGFRPKQRSLYELAENERLKIKNKKQFRSIPQTLKELAKATMTLNVQSPGSWVDKHMADETRISSLISDEIVRAFNGDRQMAQREFQKNIKIIFGFKNLSGWSDLEKEWLNRLSPVISVLCKSDKKVPLNLNLIQKWIRSKTETTEANFIRLTQFLEFIWKRYDT